MTAKVLIVDDVAINTRLLKAKLKSEYYQVVAEQDGFSAINRAECWQPDLILLDVMMPGMDGFECCRRLKARNETTHIPIIMLTALGDPNERIKGLEAGADDFLTKPVDYSTLLIRVKSLIRLKKLIDEWRARSETAISFGVDPVRLEQHFSTECKITIFDDGIENTQLLEGVLTSAAIRSQPFTPDEDFKKANLISQDLIVVNLCSRMFDALEVISRIRSEIQVQTTPILALSESTIDKRRLATAFELGVSDWICFPLDPNELSVRCRNLLKRKHYQAVLKDQVDRAIQMMAIDPLTGLYNRRYLDKHLQIILERNDAGPMSVLMIDIDHFKSINDKFGHAFGDTVIRTVSRVLSHNTRAFDTVVRYGGEEFVVLLPSTNEKEALAIAERLLHGVRQLKCEFGMQEVLRLSISIGIASGSVTTFAPHALLNFADAALYRAKQLGRNRAELRELPT